MIFALLILFLLLEIANAATTIYGIRNGLREANQILRKLFAKLGLRGGLAVMKLPVMAGAIYCVVVEGAGLTFLSLLVIPFSLLLANNLYQIRKSRI